MDQQFIDSAITVGGSILAALVGWLLKKGSDYITVRVRNEAIAGFIRRLDDLALRVVKEVYMAYVAPLKEDGKWTPMTALKAKNNAVAALRVYLGPKGLEELGRLFGQPPEGVIGTFVEAAVHDNKQHADVLKDIGAPLGPLPAPAKP